MRILRTLAAAALAALAIAQPARADQILGPGRIDSAGKVLLPGGPTLGRWRAGKYIATPDTIEVQSDGSSGPASGLSVKAPGASGSRLLSDFVGSAQFNLSTVAALRAWPVAPLITNASVQLSGYYAARDGGGGLFTWAPTSTATDDACTVIQPSSQATGRWLRIYDATTIDVRWCGAKGDGIADDQPAIQTAINVVGSANGGQVSFPIALNFYGIGSTLIMRNSVQLVGVGRNLGAGQDGSYKASILKPLVNMSAMIAQADYTQPLAKVGIIRMHLDGRSYDGVAVQYLVDLTFHNSVIERSVIANGSFGGIHIRNNSLYAWINWIRDNYIGGFGNVGLNFEGTDSHIEGNYISNALSTNVLLNSTGAITFTGNRLELAGNPYSTNKNVNAFALTLTNNTTSSIAPFSYNVINANVFLENANDISLPDAPSPLENAPIISANQMHATRGVSIKVGLNNNGGNASSNVFSDIGGPCIQFATGSYYPGGWSIGPNSFGGATRSATGRYANVPTGTAVIGLQ